MSLSENDQRVIDAAKRRFVELTGEEPEKVFVDTKETLSVRNADYCPMCDSFSCRCNGC
ncbi:hypothetical protein R50073_24210 [Maricurvus nonylphenolicus]|uniref:hypothetical protein n=1 Tax=Maricurvus nonylphenolicus TaxID=1008307 RepID=UPI0036F33331